MYNFLIQTIFHSIQQNDPLNQWLAASAEIRKYEALADVLSCLNIFIYKGNMTAFGRHVNKRYIRFILTARLHLTLTHKEI